MQYPQEVKAFILDNATGISTAELTRMLNETFGSSYTKDQIRYYKKNHKIRSGKPGGAVSKLFPDEIQDFIFREAEGKLVKELTAAVNVTFGSNYTVDQIRSYKKNHKISSGVDCRFKKGHPSDRKGKHFYAPGSEKGQFKKGHVPHNYAPVGTEIITEDGYHRTKVADPNVWEFTHRIIYEENFGPVPEEHMIIFKDGNKDNLAADNLAAITNDVHLEMIRSKTRSDIPEITEAAVTLARFNVTRRKARKKAWKKEKQ